MPFDDNVEGGDSGQSSELKMSMVDPTKDF